MRVKGHTARGVVGKVIRTGLFTSVGMAGLLAGAPAWADSSVCETTGDVTLFACSASVNVRVESGDTSLTVDGANITDGNINYNTWDGTTVGQIDMTLDVNNSVVNSTDYGGVNMYTEVADGANVQITLGEDVSITSSAGFGGVWVKNELAGDITIDSDADLTVSGTETNGIAATTNAGSVHITNSGTITVQETANAAAFTQRGIYADGGFNNAEPVEVTVTNSGTVNAQAAGIRAVNYNGLAKIQNSGTVTSVNNQALVAWTPNGKVVIINDETGNVSSDSGPAIQGASQIGDISITNDGIASGVIGINAIAGFDENEPGNGDITIDNSGTLTALGGTGIYAWTPEGDVTLTNAGSVESDQQGVSLDSLDGTVSITNSGSITGAYGIVTNDAATKIINSGKIESTDISGNAILMGAGDVTLELHAGAEIIGSIADADPLFGTNALVLGGDSDGSFDAGQIAQYEGFTQFNKTGDSTWTLTGTGSTGWTIEEGTLTANSGAAFGVDQAYVVNGGSLDIAGTTASIASLGGTADGTVNIGTGGKLTLNQGAAGSYAGQFTGSGSLTKAGSGTLTLTGDSSDFTGYLYLTEGATVIDGDTMGAGVVFLGSIDEPTLTVQNGGVLDAANVIVGNSTNNALPGIEDESGSLTVTGSQSTLNADFLTVGYYGDGSLTIADGGKVVSDSVISVGAVEGSTGTITISGEDSRLEGGSLQFGGSGTGVLNLSGGATMETTSGGFGVNAGASGTGTISGEGTRWDITQSSLTIGSAGEGILSVTEGAVVHAASGDVKLGASAGGEGKLTVSGAGSSVTTGTNFVIGNYGSGNVSVDSGAKIGGANLIVGFVDGSDGVLDVSGANTLAQGNSYVMVGTYAGSSGAITLSDDATLKADGNRGITLAYEAGSTGTLNIGAAAGDSAAAAGTIDAVKGIQFGGGAGKLVLNHTDSDYEMTAGLSGVGVVDVLAGTTVFAGDSSNYAGALNLKGGKLVLANTTSAASTTIDADGTLQIGNGGATGSLNGDILNNGELVFNRSDALHHNRVISGTGNLTVESGVITLSGMNTFTGATTIDAGATLALSNQGRVNQSSLVTVNGTFDVTQASAGQIDDLTGDGVVILGDAGLQIANASQVFSGKITGIGGVGVNGGTLTLTGDSDFQNGLGISNGATVNIGNGGTSGSISANVTNYGTLVFDRTDDVSYAGQITGQGTVIKTGDNTVTFSGAMSGVQLDVQHGTALSLGSISSDVLVGADGTLVFANPASTGYKGKLTGTGSVVKAGAGTTTFSGDSSAFAGTTTLEGGTVLLTGKLGGEVVIQSQGTLQVGNGLKDGDLLGDTTNDGTLIFNQVSDYDYAGALSGNGSLIKKGEGSLLLSGDYSYTGSTIVEGGLVRLAALLDSDTDLVLNSGTFDLDGKTQEVSGLSGLAGTLLLGTGSLNVRQQWDSVFGGIISGNVPGSFTKSGTGSLNLTGASTFTGLVNVAGGRLAINGTLPGAVSVFGGATLGGTGTAGSVTVQGGGTLAPGNSIGTLTTIGDVLFEDGSVYEVEVNAQGDSDKLLVGGKATIEGGTVSVLAAAGNYRWNSDYVIISAADGVTGQFDDTDVDLPFLTPYLRYDLNDVVLTLGRNDRSFASVAGTPNQLAVAAALDASDQNASLPRAVAGQIEEAGAVRAFDSLSGELWATTGTLMVDRSRRLGEMVVSRLEQADSMSASHSMADRQTRDGQTTIWGQGIGAWNTLKSDGNAATATQSSYGFITGIDTLLGDWRLGVAFSHGKDEVQIDGRSSEATVEGSSVAAYIGGGWGPLHTRIGATYSWLDVTGSRGVEFPGVSDTLVGGYDAKSASAFGEISYAFPLGGAVFEPFAGVNHVHLKSDAFTESGSALSALGVDESTRDVTYTMLGLRLGGAKPLSEGTMIVPRASAAWLHSFGDTEAISRHTLPTGEAFSIAGLPTKRDTLQVEAGLQVNILPGGSIGATYIGNIGDQWKDHGVKLGFSYSF